MSTDFKASDFSGKAGTALQQRARQNLEKALVSIHLRIKDATEEGLSNYCWYMTEPDSCSIRQLEQALREKGFDTLRHYSPGRYPKLWIFW